MKKSLIILILIIPLTLSSTTIRSHPTTEKIRLDLVECNNSNLEQLQEPNHNFDNPSYVITCPETTNVMTLSDAFVVATSGLLISLGLVFTIILVSY